jgi:hypothetical protein
MQGILTKSNISCIAASNTQFWGDHNENLTMLYLKSIRHLKIWGQFDNVMFFILETMEEDNIQRGNIVSLLQLVKLLDFSGIDPESKLVKHLFEGC